MLFHGRPSDDGMFGVGQSPKGIILRYRRRASPLFEITRTNLQKQSGNKNVIDSALG